MCRRCGSRAGDWRPTASRSESSSSMSTCGGARPGPVVGAAGRKGLCGRQQGRLSRSPRSLRANSARSSAGRPTGEATSRIWRRRSARRRLCRATEPDRGRTAERRLRSHPPFWPAANGSRSSNRSQTPSSWRRRQRSGTPRSSVGLIAVLCAAVLALLIARSLTRPIVRLTEAVQGGGRDGKAIIPVEASGETGVLARAFAQVMEEVNAKTVALEREVAEHRRTVAARDHHAERERLFSAAVESSNDAIITMSLDGTITGWNSAAERLFGYTAAEAAGKNITLLVPADRLPEVQDALAPDRLGRKHRAQRNGAAAKGRQSGRGLAQHLPDQGALRRDHRHLEGRARHHRSQQDPAGAAAADRRASPHLRDLAGSDHGDGFQGIPGPDQPELRKPYWAIGRRK